MCKSTLKNSCLILGLVSIILFLTSYRNSSFKEEQLKYPRVQASYKEKESSLKQLCKAHNISLSKINILIRIFKTEKVLEVWAKETGQQKFIKLKDYPICKTSGLPGPKRFAGDGQTPEGFYYVERFNPSSNFYLSLGINYPNSSDRILSAGKDMGGDIFIHGNCVTIGCVPITDDLIKEVYLLAVEARSNGQQKIPVYIFPTRMTTQNMAGISAHIPDKKIIKFWANIQEGYDYFENNHLQVPYTILNNGDYSF